MKKPLLLPLLAVSLLCRVAPAHAATYSWINDTGTNSPWNDANNWAPIAPATGFPNEIDAVVHINGAFTKNVTVELAGSPVLGTLNLGDALGGDSLIRFAGGGASQGLTMRVSSGSAQINKTTANEVRVERTFNFRSDTVISVTGGLLSFANGNARLGVTNSVGNLFFEGVGGKTVFASSATSSTFSNSFTGDVTIRNGGTLEVNNLFQAASSTAARVTVASTGKLMGSGTIGRSTVVQSGGLLNPGSSGGILTFSEGLELQAGSATTIELFSNTTGSRGEALGYDGVNISAGNLTIAETARIDLVFNGAGSTVDFSNAFWDEEQQWLLFQSAGTLEVSGGIFELGSISTDSQGAAFGTTGGQFSFLQVGNDVYLQYTAVPEPGSVALWLGAGVGCLLYRARRKR